MRHLCESGLRENRTSRLSGGRRPALRGASSDPTPLKRANKGAGASAEPVEGRASTEGNPRRARTRRTQGRESVTQAAERIRRAATRKPQERLTALLHHVTPDALRWAFHALKRDAAAGVDGMTWAGYAEGLDERLLALHRRVQTGAYRAPPVRRVEIAKPDGGTRPLGVAALEDKIVQKAAIILVPIYEPAFLGFSYGFRPGRGAHDALDALAVALERRKVNWVVDCDIREPVRHANFLDVLDDCGIVLTERSGPRG